MEQIAGGLLVISAALASWIARGVVGPYLHRKGENLATKEDVAEITRRIEEVRNAYVQQTEHLRYELQGSLQREAILLHRLHGRRALAIDGLYKRLVRTQERFEPLAGAIKPLEDQEYQERLDAAGEMARELLRFFNEHRLYFDSAVVGAFNEFHGSLGAAWLTFVHERREQDWRYLDPEDRKEQVTLWREARERIRTGTPSLLSETERAMRILLGEKPAPPQESVPAVPETLPATAARNRGNSETP